jgi:hypothetical protein
MTPTNKREARSQIKRLISQGMITGLTPSQSYKLLSEAKKLSEEWNIIFPDDVQQRLTRQAKILLSLAINYEITNRSREE